MLIYFQPSWTLHSVQPRCEWGIVIAVEHCPFAPTTARTINHVYVIGKVKVPYAHNRCAGVCTQCLGPRVRVQARHRGDQAVSDEDGTELPDHSPWGLEATRSPSTSGSSTSVGGTRCCRSSRRCSTTWLLRSPRRGRSRPRFERRSSEGVTRTSL